MIRRLIRFWRWIGQSGTSAVMAAQFGLAIMPLCSLMRPPLISGMTSGTFGSMRNADELSITTAPAFTATGANFLDMAPPAENSAISTPWNELSVSSSTTISRPRKLSLWPAERLLASAFSPPTRKPRRSMVAMNSAPTAPVTPAMAITGSSGTWLSMILSFRQQKSPGPSSGGASVDGDAADNLRAHDSPSPRGLFGFRRGFHGHHHCGRDHMG